MYSPGYYTMHLSITLDITVLTSVHSFDTAHLVVVVKF